MIRFFRFCILVLLAQGFAVSGMAQESLRALTQMDRDQVLDWRNPELNLDLNIPPGASAATLTLYADPGETLPVSGTLMLVSINGHEGIVVDPKPQAFSARIDLPVSHLQAGRNTIRIAFEGSANHACPIKGDGGWRLDLARSRFDLSISANITSFSVLEDWLAQGAWALDRVSILQGELSEGGYAAMGALITQGLAVRAGKVPQVVSADRIAGLDFQARIESTLAGPGLALRPGARPVVELQGRNEQEVLDMARLFASRIIRLGGTRAAPLVLENAQKVQAPGALDGVKTALGQPSWDVRPFENTVRAPHFGKTRLVVELERPDWVSPDSTVQIVVDGEKPFVKRLKHQLNHFTILMDPKSATVKRVFSIARQARPSTSETGCVDKNDGAPLRLLSARIESNGFEQVDRLSRFAIDAAPFGQQAGQKSAIVLATNNDAQLRAAWRTLARISLVSGAPLSNAWYGTQYRMAPKDAALMVLGPRDQLAPPMLANVPPSFAKGAAAGPRDYEQNYKKNPYKAVQAAFADEANVPPGLGVAGWTRIGEREALLLTGDHQGDFIPAMQAMADGPAMDFFAGNVVRWRAGLVEINDIGGGAGVMSRKGKLSAWLYIIAGISLIGLWICLWRRVYANWSPS
jgi:hypothetical protein